MIKSRSQKVFTEFLPELISNTTTLMTAKAFFVFLFLFFFMSACANHVRRDIGFESPDGASNAASLLATINQRNKSLRSVKGIGKIKLWGEKGSQVTRLAWLGSSDGRLRVEVLGLSGQPVVKFIYDGKRFFFLSHIDQQFYQKTCLDPDLNPLTGIDIKVSEIVLFLSGGIPIHDHDTVLLQHLGAGEGYVLIFKKKWLWVVEKIYLDESLSVVNKVEAYNWRGMLYRAVLAQTRNINNHAIPFNIVISTDSKEGFSIAADRCWTDITVLPEMFSIDPIQSLSGADP